MKHLPIFVICSFLTACSSVIVEDDNCSYESFGLIYPAKSVKQTTYHAVVAYGEISKGYVTANQLRNYYAEFNEQGKISEWTLFGSGGSVFDKQYFVYNSDNRLISKSGGVSRDYSFSYEYDGGSLSLISYVASDGTKKLSKYTNAGNNVTKLETYLNGTLRSVQKIYYKNNKRIKFTSIDKTNGEERVISTFSYDDIGRRTLIHSNGTEMRIEYNGNGAVSSVSGGELNDGGLFMINSEMSNSYTYKYDSKGNWIERIDFEEPSHLPIEITERIIQY